MRVDLAIGAIVFALFLWSRDLYNQFGVDSQFAQWRKSSRIELIAAEKKLKGDLERSNYPSEEKPSGTTEQWDPSFAFRFQSPVDLTANPPGRKITICTFDICKPAKVESVNPEDDQQPDRVRATLEANGHTLHYQKVIADGKPGAFELCDVDLVHDVSRVTITRNGPTGKPAQRGETYTLTIETRCPVDPSRTINETISARISTLPLSL